MAVRITCATTPHRAWRLLTRAPRALAGVARSLQSPVTTSRARSYSHCNGGSSSVAPFAGGKSPPRRDLFDPSTFAGTRSELGDATCLPGDAFTSEAWYKAELEKVFRPTWLLIGREDELGAAGNYLTLDAPGVGPVMAVRGKDDQIRAFANVCRHRGAVLLRKDCGQLKGGIVCPYHAWAFGLDGRLRGAPLTTPKKRRRRSQARGDAEVDTDEEDDADSAAAAAAAAIATRTPFDKKNFPLMQVRLESYGGFLFVNGAGAAAPSLLDSLGNCPEVVLGRWPLADMVTCGRKEYIVNCNWKFLFENTAETYHTSFVHKDSLGPMPSQPVASFAGAEPVGDWDAVHVPTERSVVPLPGEAAPFDEITNTTFFTNLFPSLQVNVTHDCVWWMRMLPMAIDKTRVTQGFLFPRETAERADFEDLVKPYRYRWDLAVREDNEISENQQKGAESLYYVPGPYNGLEFGTHKFDNFVVDRVIGSQ